MSCPTCSHTMSRLGCQYSECRGSWACPRCGTLKIGHEDGHFDIVVPSLVERCREFVVFMETSELVGNEPDWSDVVGHVKNLAEAAFPPGRRPK